jgi:hypothetical protein
MEDKELSARFAALHARFDNTKRIRENPPQLAHYTSVQRLEKIIQEEQIWLSNPLYMNDLEEMRFGLNVGAHLFLSSPAIRQAAGSDERAQRLRDAFFHYFKILDTEGALDTYVFCLCEHERNNDDGILSMWRGYGGHGNGAALVFETAAIPVPPAAPLYITPVHYGSADQRIKWLNGLLEQWSKIVQNTEISENQLYIAAQSFLRYSSCLRLQPNTMGFVRNMNGESSICRKMIRESISHQD